MRCLHRETGNPPQPAANGRLVLVGIASERQAYACIGTLVYPIAKRHVDHVVLVPDEAINRAQLALWETLRVVAEPGGAAAFAALISGRYASRPGEPVGVFLSGGNTTAVNFG